MSQNAKVAFSFLPDFNSEKEVGNLFKIGTKVSVLKFAQFHSNKISLQKEAHSEQQLKYIQFIYQSASADIILVTA